MGDWDGNDEVFGDLTLDYEGVITGYLSLGRGVNKISAPRDYIIARVGNDLFTIEGGVLSEYGYKNISEFAFYKYYWGAVHPKNFFLAVGNEIDRTYLLFGTKELKNFGNFTFLNMDRENKNFWFRSQFGFGEEINHGFYSQETYLLATSYLVVPPFFYLHFSPIATKGDYALKVDWKKNGVTEHWEVIGAKNLYSLGRLAVGWLEQVDYEGGVVGEYYKEIRMGSNFSVIGEFRYEGIYKNFSGFITTQYMF